MRVTIKHLNEQGRCMCLASVDEVCISLRTLPLVFSYQSRCD